MTQPRRSAVSTNCERVGLCMEEEKQEWNKGMGTSDLCPRRGMVYLNPSSHEMLGIPTNCKSWRCVSCRNRKLGMVASLMQYGLSELGQTFLISITYIARLTSSGLLEKFVDAQSANKDWRALVRILKKNPQYKNLTTFRIVELTKRKQVHFHLLMGGLPTTITKEKIDCGQRKDWRCCVYPRCYCLTCEWSNIWFQVTHDSYIVHVKETFNDEGVAWYLCKYLQKSMYGPQRKDLEDLGFSRRYYRSNNWASQIQMRRRGSLEKQWKRVKWEPSNPNKFIIEHSKDHPLMEQLGTDLAKTLQAKGRYKHYATLHEKMGQQADSSGS